MKESDRNMHLLSLLILSVLSVDCKESFESHGNSTDENHHGGVSLVSFRWEEYREYIYFTLIILVASLLKIGFHHVPRLAAYFPESCVLIVFGLVMGGIIDFCFEDTHAFPKFTNTLFFNVLLPPIVLDASYSMYDEDFFGNLDAILLFAVVGTIFNVFIIAFLINLIAPITFVQCLVFSSIVSAVDPVAVLAIFEEIHVNSVLYFLVFGESLLNDGVTIVLYNTVVILSKQDHIDYSQYVLAVISFFTVVFGGLLVGVSLGVVNSIILRLTKKDHIRVLEPLVIVTFAYFSYILAELFHWSGIISLIGCGIMQKRYAFLNASKKSYTTVKYSVKTVASVADCIIFIFLGKVAVKMFYELEVDLAFICWSLLFCTLVRVVGVLLLSNICNWHRMKAISLREQFIMAYGGLRGAVSFSLAYILDDSNESKSVFLTTTLVVIFFTVFIQGGSIKMLVDFLHIKKKSVRDKTHIFCDVHKKTSDYLMTGVETILGNISISSYFHIVQALDERYIKKVLVRKRIIDRMTLRLEKITLDEHFARLYGPTVIVEETARLVRQRTLVEEEEGPTCDREEHLSPEASSLLEQQPLSSPPPPAPVEKLPRVSTEHCLASLNRAFLSNPYERYKTRKATVGDILEGEDSYQGGVLAQLKYRSLQTREIERRLLHANTLEKGSDSEISNGGGDCVNDTEGSDSSDIADLQEAKPDSDGGGAGLGCSWGEDGIPMRNIHKRTRSSMTAGEVRKQYLKAKRRFKSFQQ